MIITDIIKNKNLNKNEFRFGKRFGRNSPKNKNPHSQGLRGFKGGPTWARTRDQLIMSQLL